MKCSILKGNKNKIRNLNNKSRNSLHGFLTLRNCTTRFSCLPLIAYTLVLFFFVHAHGVDAGYLLQNQWDEG